MNIIRDKSGKLPIKLILIVLVVSIGIGAFAFTKMGSKGGKHVEEKIELTEIPLEEFTVNLADKNESRYMKVSIVLELDGKFEAAGGHGASAEVKCPQEPKARDIIITGLSKKTYGELLTDDGKDQLKEELKTALNEVLEEHKVHGIYFTSFVME